MPPAPSSPTRVLVDADLSLPAALAERAGIEVAPADAALLTARENIPRLMVEAGTPLEAAPVVEAARRLASDGGTVIYVSTADPHGRPAGAAEEARAAAEEAGGRLLHLDAGGVLMAAGWRAVIAAEAIEAGAGAEDALAAASAPATHLMALVEHPELAGESTPGNLGQPNRIVALIDAAGFALDSSPRTREAGLKRLRDHFAATVEGARGLRVAVHHGGSGPAAEAMATWIERHVQPREVHVSPITRHAGTRYGPGFVAIAWVAEG